MKNIKFQTEDAAEEFARRLNKVPEKIVFGHSSNPYVFWLTRPTWPAGEGRWWTQRTASPNARVQKYGGVYLVTYGEEFEKEANDCA